MKMMMKNNILLLCLCIATASCASLGKYKPVEEVSPSIYGNIAAENAGTESIAASSWQNFFSDRQLQSLISTALEGNIDLQAATEHIVQAEAKLTGAKLSYIPTFGISGAGTEKFVGDNFATKAYEYSLAATSSWQLSIFRLINNHKAAMAGVEQMNDYYQAVRSQLVASVANNYYTLLMLDAQLRTSKEMQAAWEKSVETVIALKDAGLADQVAVSQYQANLDMIIITVKSLVSQISGVENAMNLLLGRESGSSIERGQLKDQVLPSQISAGVPVQMLANRPDVRAAQRDMELAYYSTRGAILNYFPALSINGSIGLVNPATGALSPMTLLGTVGAGLAAPILNAGKNRAALETAKSMQREAELAFNSTLLNAGVEVNDAFREYNSCLDMEKNYFSRAEALDKAREDTEYLMKNSLDKTYLDVLYAHTNFFDAKLSVIANQAKKMQAAVAIYAALGGGAL